MLEETSETEIAEPVAARNRQVSLLELFFATTIVAVSLGAFQYLSEAIAVFAGGVLLVYGVTRVWPPINPIVGAVRGFGVATLIGWSLFLLGYGDQAFRFSFILFLPPLGYVLGFYWSELNRVPT